MSAGPRAPRVVCVTPVKNEAWILPQFLAAASLWADEIVIADQGSTDDSAAIASCYPKVRLVHNHLPVYDEAGRQRILLAAARTLSEPCLLVPLDADEFLSPGFFSRDLLTRLAVAGPGAHVRTRWYNVRPDLECFWAGQTKLLAGWLDNGRAVRGAVIHGERLPVAEGDPEVSGGEEGAILHWQYTMPARLWSKHRWYQAWERLNRAHRHPVDVYRQYHHMVAIPRQEIHPLPTTWLSWYKNNGVDLTAIADDGFHWWNQELLEWMGRYGSSRFALAAIWDFDWEREADRQGLPACERFRDPRTWWQRLLHRWLERSQPWQRAWPVRLVDAVLRRTVTILL